jgi:hypothetical protein
LTLSLSSSPLSTSSCRCPSLSSSPPSTSSCRSLHLHLLIVLRARFLVLNHPLAYQIFSAKSSKRLK